MNKQKIVILIDWYLPGSKAGGPVRSIYSLISLIKNYFDIYLITTNYDLGRTEGYEEITANKLFKTDEVNYFYFTKDKLNIENICSEINKINPHLVYLNSFWSFNFSIGIVKAKRNNLITAPVLLAPRGMLGKGALGLKPLRKTVFIFLSRLLGWYKKMKFHATNQLEKKDIQSKFKNAEIFTVSNVNSGVPLFTNKDKEIKQLKLFYLSRISTVKNLHFAIEILNQIPADIKIEYDIFGNLEDKNYWEKCTTLINNLPANIKVNYKYELPFNEVQNVIINYHALFLPTLNENFGHSIVESLLSGCAAIISDQTPWNDLEINNAGFALSLNNKSGFVSAIVNLALLNKEEFELKSKASIKYISSKLNIEESITQYKNMFHESISN